MNQTLQQIYHVSRSSHYCFSFSSHVPLFTSSSIHFPSKTSRLLLLEITFSLSSQKDPKHLRFLTFTLHKTHIQPHYEKCLCCLTCTFISELLYSNEDTYFALSFTFFCWNIEDIILLSKCKDDNNTFGSLFEFITNLQTATLEIRSHLIQSDAFLHSRHKFWTLQKLFASKWTRICFLFEHTHAHITHNTHTLCPHCNSGCFVINMKLDPSRKSK